MKCQNKIYNNTVLVSIFGLTSLQPASKVSKIIKVDSIMFIVMFFKKLRPKNPKPLECEKT
jgi:hypothetical protein